MGVEPFLVTSSLNAVIAQRLIRRVCRDCGKEMERQTARRRFLQNAGLPIEKVMRGPGCPACNMTGYRGRIAIHEVLVLDDEMREVINNGGSSAQLREIAIRNKTVFLIDDGLLKVKQGITTTEEVLRVALIE